MCGIVGYVGERQAAAILVAGLTRLEYRGYDSAGIALVDGDVLHVVRATGKLRRLEAKVAQEAPQGTVGVGHTRWATHGRPSDENAHPHSFAGVSVVHNGIIENHMALKVELAGQGHVFSSETDSEVFAHLVHQKLQSGMNLEKAVRAATLRVQGTYALLAVTTSEDNCIVATRQAQPMVLGLGHGETFLASDVPALLEYTRTVVFMEDGDIAVVTKAGPQLFNSSGASVKRPVHHIDWTPAMAEKGGHKHFMHKELCEQPRAVADTLRGRMLRSQGQVHFEEWTLSDAEVQALSRLWILACGTSYHAGLLGKWMIEALAQLPVEVELAGEFRYRNPLVAKGQLAVAISQSGETLDTLAAMREAKGRHAVTMALCNVVASTLTREADFTVLTHAGPEIGVAATKAFTTQLVVLYLLAMKLGFIRGTLSAKNIGKHFNALAEVPASMERVLKSEAHIRVLARKYMHARDFLFLGRGPFQSVALEGALKLKEISYIHAEGHASSEMKHGPIALIDERMPVLVLAPGEPTVHYAKMIGNIEEVKARGGLIIAVADEGDRQVQALADDFIGIPKASALVAAIIAAIPLQLLAYHVADLRGTDVDQPRNLAKSVTVE